MATTTAESEFRAAASARGLDLPASLAADGKLHRCGTTERPHKKDGSYLLHLDDRPAGGFVNHRDGLPWENWTAKITERPTALELKERAERVAAARAAAAEDTAARHAEAARRASEIWQGSKLVEIHPYLSKKGVRSNGLRATSGGVLLVPLFNSAGELRNLQRISEDGKRFLAGGEITGCFHPIGPPLSGANVIVICEGYATAATIHEVTGLPVVSATSCGNLGPVARALRAEYPMANFLIAADNDTETKGNPGVTHAEAAAKLVGGRAVIPKLPGGAKGDFNDLLLVTGGPEAVKEQIFAPPTREPASFMSSIDRLEGEAEQRIEDGKHLIGFGIDFLNDALYGIMRTDLVLFGAEAGSGKTAAAVNIALANTAAGKRVHYFALEAEPKEIERRIKFRILCSLYYGSPGGHRPIRYRQWRIGMLENILAPFEAQARARLRDQLRGLKTYYRVGNFTGTDFERLVNEVCVETDLVILDHFHYVDTEDRDENRGAKQIIKQVRETVLEANRPVMMIGHVRKGDSPRFAPLVPTKDAFMGTSDLVKIATLAIMMAPDYETKNDDPTVWYTYMQIAKDRTDASSTRYVARLQYDIKTGLYRREYDIGRLIKGGREFVNLLPIQCPEWAYVPPAKAQPGFVE
jgi:putative DNA primase/helicase